MRYINYYPLITVLFSVCLYTQDDVHFYYAQKMSLKPRLEHNWLTTWEITFGGGGTKKSYNNASRLVPLLDIYGYQNMTTLGRNLTIRGDNNLNNILKELSELPAQDFFGHFSTHGHFDFLETNIIYTQNFYNNFFLQGHLPIRSLEIDDINFIDLSPNNTDIFPHKQTPVWQNFLMNFERILNQYDINCDPVHIIGAGDLSFCLGWTHNYQETIELDFVDTTLQAGIIIPTGKKKNEREIFSLPLGYDGHWGFPLQISITIGAYEWLTIGCGLKNIFFIPKERTIGIKTDYDQPDFFLFNQKRALIKKGLITQIGTYIQADHFSRGLSFELGYSYTQQQKTCIETIKNYSFNKSIANSSPRFKNFNMHTLHISFEYDFTKYNWLVGPRIGMSCNYQIKGTNTFNTHNAYGLFAVDIALTY